MERHVEQRSATILGFVRELLQEPTVRFPLNVINLALTSTFDVTSVAWHWRAADGSYGISVAPRWRRYQSGEGWAMWEAGKLLDVHPLVQWHLRTQDAHPQTMTRVPYSLVARKERDFMRGLVRPLGCEEQLTIPSHVEGIEHRMFVLARSGSDFSEDDLGVARRIQPALAAVHQQLDLYDRLGLGRITLDGNLGLTARELVVLRLLSDGHSTRGIARLLATSPRTVEKHLEHIYRKIHVNDRLNAIRVAQEVGLLPHWRPAMNDPAADRTTDRMVADAVLSKTTSPRELRTAPAAGRPVTRVRWRAGRPQA